MLDHGYPLGLATLKAVVLEPDKPKVPDIMDRLVKEKRVIEVKKNRYMKG